MRVYQTDEIKNIALLGSAGSGKTTLAESMLYEAGVIKRRGTVEGKNTVSDYFPVELEYGYSVFPTVFHVEWNNKKLNIIDCPGSDDFVGSAITALNVTDTAIHHLLVQEVPCQERNLVAVEFRHVLCGQLSPDGFQRSIDEETIHKLVKVDEYKNALKKYLKENRFISHRQRMMVVNIL